MITSSVPNEGKSFITMQLWRMMAEVGSRGAFDRLRPAQVGDARQIRHQQRRKDHRHRPLSGRQGGACRTRSTPPTSPNGFLMPLAASVANPSILLENPRFAEMIEVCAGQFDYVLIDTPPPGKRGGTPCASRPTPTVWCWWCAAAGPPQAGGRRSGEAAADRGANPGGGPQPGGNGPERQPLLQTLLLQWVLQQRVRP